MQKCTLCSHTEWRAPVGSVLWSLLQCPDRYVGGCNAIVVAINAWVVAINDRATSLCIGMFERKLQTSFCPRHARHQDHADHRAVQHESVHDLPPWIGMFYFLVMVQ